MQLISYKYIYLHGLYIMILSYMSELDTELYRRKKLYRGLINGNSHDSLDIMIHLHLNSPKKIVVHYNCICSNVYIGVHKNAIFDHIDLPCNNIYSISVI